jgi:integrase
LSGRELRALRRLKREQEPASPFIFTSERGAPFTTAGFRKMIARLGIAAGFGFLVHPHMLRQCMRLSACQSWRRYPLIAGLSRSSQYSAHHALR